MENANEPRVEERGSRLSGLSGLAIRRPVFASMVMLGLIVLGIFGYRQLAIDQFPNVDIPVITVQTTYPGASAETIEREVTRRMEEAFNPVQGVDKITSVSLEGVSQVIVEFDLDRNVDAAAADIRAKIETIRRDLPEDIDPPIVEKFDPASLPIVSLALSSNSMPLVNLTSLADETIRRRLENVRGVGEVRIAGGLEREVRIFILPSRLQAVGVSVSEVMAALQSQNLEIPAGRVEKGGAERLVRVTGRITDPDQFGEVIVANRGGQPIRLKDVARVEEGNEEERSLALVNGERAVSLDILKVSGANTVEVADGVRAALEEMRNGVLPAGTSLQVVRDNSVVIRQSVHDVIDELILGAFLTVLVVMIFLNDWKATLITALALPVSVISSFIIMNALGFTLNVLTLMALSLSIGILIDDAIVVVENIVRHREMGEDHFTAAGRGTKEIMLAVMATTFTVVAVFVPVAFMGGIIGRFFYQFGITVAWAVLVSLFVSFTLTPMLSAWWGVNPHKGSGENGHGTGKRPNVLTRTIARFNEWFDSQAGKYRSVIKWALGHRKTTLAVAAAAFFGAIALFPLIGGGFMPDSDNGEFVVQFETPEGSSLQYTRGKAEQIIRTLNSLNGVDYTYTTIGSGATGTVTKGEIYVKLLPRDERSATQDELMVAARKQLSPIVATDISVLVGGGLGGAVAPLQVELRGPDVAELQRLSSDLMTRVKAIPGIVDVKSSLGDPKPEYRINVNRDIANEVGLNIGQIATTIRPVLAGETATRWEDPTGEERDVVVQVAPEQRRTVEDIATIPLATSRRTADGAVATVPLRDVADIQLGTAPAQIDRKNLQRVATISGSTAPELSIAEASQAIQQVANEMELPAGYSVHLGGETEDLQETTGYVLESITLAIILIFLILASQFESFTQPFAIMLSLPLSLVGVLLALLLTNDTMNMMSMIGVIMLMGLVTKNAILLVDNANERRATGTDRFTALVEAGAVRLRPIIMTTLAMIFGMLPIAFALGEGGGFRAPMARAVIGGLITSTMLTLVVVPVAYTYFDDMGGWFKRRLTSPERVREIEAERETAGLTPEPVWGD
ncbi:MAG TPA: efflux RND transporter permease subunit [Gemmatimonadaceae bacterium]|nr:efflux RND transporter permease subunit [Gemmatimonadaceae bacterium]